MGYDDPPLVALTKPALTTIQQPLQSMSVAAVRALMDLIRGDDTPSDEYVFRTELIVRGSTAPPARVHAAATA